MRNDKASAGMPVQKVVRIFKSFEEAEKADREFYKSLTPDQRLEILVELVRQRQSETEPGFERVCRITELA